MKLRFLGFAILVGACAMAPASDRQFSAFYELLFRTVPPRDVNLASSETHHHDDSTERIVESAWQEAQKATVDESKNLTPHERDLKWDKDIGKQYSEQVEKENKLSKNQALIDRLNRVAAKIIPIAQREQVKVSWGDPRLNVFDYKFKLIEGKQVNAFSLPGGYIYFYEGLLNFTESDDELAGVVGHEIAHAAFRHVATLSKEQSKFDLVTLPLILVTILSGGKVGGDALMLSQLANQAAGSGWGQKAEFASDYGSFQYLLKSEYNPVGNITFLERLARDQRTLESIDWGIYRSHPPSKERADKLIQYCRDAKLPVRRSLVSSSFRVQIREEKPGINALMFNGRKIVELTGGADRAQSVATGLNEFFDQVPELYEIQTSSGGVVLGRRRALFQLSPADAQLSNQSLEKATEQVTRELKRALFNYAYRVWDTR